MRDLEGVYSTVTVVDLARETARISMAALEMLIHHIRSCYRPQAGGMTIISVATGPTKNIRAR
jgi:hypothetical protein